MTSFLLVATGVLSPMHTIHTAHCEPGRGGAPHCSSRAAGTGRPRPCSRAGDEAREDCLDRYEGVEFLRFARDETSAGCPRHLGGSRARFTAQRPRDRVCGGDGCVVGRTGCAPRRDGRAARRRESQGQRCGDEHRTDGQHGTCHHRPPAAAQARAETSNPVAASTVITTGDDNVTQTSRSPSSTSIDVRPGSVATSAPRADESPRPASRAASAAAPCKRAACAPATTAPAPIAMTSSTAGRVTANSAATEPRSSCRRRPPDRRTRT